MIIKIEKKINRLEKSKKNACISSTSIFLKPFSDFQILDIENGLRNINAVTAPHQTLAKLIYFRKL